jgi:hypothetical protein
MEEIPDSKVNRFGYLKIGDWSLFGICNLGFGYYEWFQNNKQLI